ncbi:MAG: hypothetical protein ACYSYV_12055 [Planctomycetota bacterium]|jgi:hypothetical protein
MKPNVISEQDEQKNISNRLGRKRFAKKKVCLLLVIAFVILMVPLFYAVNIYHTPGVNELLRRAKLAKLPESIKNLQVDTRDARPVKANDRPEPKQCNLFIRFHAEPNDIDNFINNSPGIDKNNFRPLRPLPDGDEIPTWWPTDQSTSGRMYVSHESKYIYGMVAVYDDSNTVRICVWYIVNPQLIDMQIAFEDIRDGFEDFLDDLLHEVLDLFGD